jgi:transposase
MDTIFEENVRITTKEVEDKIFVEVEEIQTPHQSIFDPRDPSVKLGKKGKTSWVGSKCHVVETAEKGKVNFLTNMIYQKANEDDSQIHGKLKEGNERRGLQPEKLYADTKYISGTEIKEYRSQGQELMGYIQGNTTKKPEDFKLQKFDINMNTLKAVCPAGKESLEGRVTKRGRIRIMFSRATCKECAFYQECVGTARDKARKLTVQPNYDYVRERRELQEKAAFRDEMKVRAQVEGTISEGVRFMGLRHAKYKGQDGHEVQFYMTGAALNVKRLIKAITNGIEMPKEATIACIT